VTFSLGADAERLSWGIAHVREAREKNGLDPDDFGFSALVNVVVDDDPAKAVALGAGSLATQQRFSGLHGKVTGPMDASSAATILKIKESYDMTRHGTSKGGQTTVLDPEFAHRFGVFGPAEYCVERLNALRELGIKRVLIAGPSHDNSPETRLAYARRFGETVIPALKATVG
jgi:5,10-methylenetetrahydromethanopterin reductase